MTKTFLQRRHFGLAVLTLPVWTWAQTGRKVLVVGDSLSAEYGLSRGTGWVAMLQAKLDRERPGIKVINASVSGETTAGGRARLDALLSAHLPQVVIIELGGNDALRGTDLQTTRGNLRAMVQAAKATGAKVILLGMRVPPNYGAGYASAFADMYTDLARQETVSLVPFFLKGVADSSDYETWFQPDRIHPNEMAQPRLLGNVWPTVKRWLP